MKPAAFTGYGLALLVGVLLGSLGGGGAILTVPILVYVFAVPVKQAVPMSLVVVGLAALLGVARHARAGHVQLRAALAFGPFAILGAYLGTVVALVVSSRLQLTVFAITLLAAAVLMLRPGPFAVASHRPPLVLTSLIGSGVGFLTGLIGVGGGFLYVPALTILVGLDMKASVGTSLALIAMSCAAGLVGYVGKVDFDWVLVFTFSALALVGVVLGTAIVPRVSQQGLRKVFAVFLLLIGGFVLIRGERRASPPAVEEAPALEGTAPRPR